MMSEFDGRLVVRLVVDNYDLEAVRSLVSEKLGELDCVVASLVGIDDEPV
jgi:hypothetical protein